MCVFGYFVSLLYLSGVLATPPQVHNSSTTQRPRAGCAATQPAPLIDFDAIESWPSFIGEIFRTVRRQKSTLWISRISAQVRDHVKKLSMDQCHFNVLLVANQSK